MATSLLGTGCPDTPLGSDSHFLQTTRVTSVRDPVRCGVDYSRPENGSPLRPRLPPKDPRRPMSGSEDDGDQPPPL